MTIILDHIDKSYGDKVVLKDFNLTVEDGKAYAITGPAGTGKSTLLGIFMERIKPDAGRVCKMGDYKYPTLHSVYVPQESSLNSKKDAIWNVKKAHRTATKKGAIEELSKFLKEESLKVPVAELTQGQQRFVEIVKAFFVPADFVVLDEPFEGMNEQERKIALDYVMEMTGRRPLLIAESDDRGLDFARPVRL
ncbi:MAG: ATP-binding cassette domain-containing protein [Pseudobutyrivibrio sp.]|nr:ATP-binding cassette domain-containing protein [Pseudobutyrivibrio sp.]